MLQRRLNHLIVWVANVTRMTKASIRTAGNCHWRRTVDALSEQDRRFGKGDQCDTVVRSNWEIGSSLFAFALKGISDRQRTQHVFCVPASK